MALAYLTSTASDEVARYSRRDYERLLYFSTLDQVGRHFLTDSPDNADVVLFVGSSEPSFRDVMTSTIYKSHSNKSVLFESGDRCIPLLPGVYAGLQKNWSRFSCGAAVSGFYIRVTENDSLDISEPIEDSRYLYSFIGNRRNHPIRKEILRLVDLRAFLRDSSRDPVQQADGACGSNQVRGRLFRDVMANSKFVLCPRGIGISSWRLFETMRAGRVPVIISDQWVPPVGPDWTTFCIFVKEREITSIPQLLTKREGEAPLLGQKAREEWLRFYDEKVIFNTVVESGLLALEQFHHRKKWLYALRRLQYLDPFFARHWLVSPWVRRQLRGAGLSNSTS